MNVSAGWWSVDALAGTMGGPCSCTAGVRRPVSVWFFRHRHLSGEHGAKATPPFISDVKLWETGGNFFHLRPYHSLTLLLWVPWGAVWGRGVSHRASVCVCVQQRVFNILHTNITRSEIKSKAPQCTAAGQGTVGDWKGFGSRPGSLWDGLCAVCFIFCHNLDISFFSFYGEKVEFVCFDQWRCRTQK